MDYRVKKMFRKIIGAPFYIRCCCMLILLFLMIFIFWGNRPADAAESITFYQWDICNDGVVNPDNVQYFWVEAYFQAVQDLTSMEYSYSSDNGATWQPIDSFITWDGDLREWSDSWSRYLDLDLTSLSEGDYQIRAIATDVYGNTLSKTTKLVVDLTAQNVTDLTVTPSGDNTALVLNWTTPEEEVNYYIIYRQDENSSYWDYLDRTTECTYSDAEALLYRNYTYKVVVVDTQGNKSIDPPTATSCLNAGPITFLYWGVDNSGLITIDNVDQYDISASFSAAKDITSIEYSYSTDQGTTWNLLDLLMRQDNRLHYDSYNNKWSRGVECNFGSLADGNYLIRAIATDVDGNTLAAEKVLNKDTASPADVSELTAKPNADNTAFVLSWKNPTEDFDHVIVQQRVNSTRWSVLTESLTESTYTDSDITAGNAYEYRVIAVDNNDNKSENPSEITVVIPVDAPQSIKFNPKDQTINEDDTTRYYEACFLDDQEVTSIVVEVSKDGGTTWQQLNADNTTPTKSYNNYTVSGYWDLSNLGEVVYQIRARATDSGGREGVTPVYTLTIDRLPPETPTNFTAVSSSNGIQLSWDSVEGVDRYYIRRELNGSYNYSWTVNSPNHTLLDTRVQSGQIYEYQLQAIDELSNRSPKVIAIGEHYTGPSLTLDNGLNTYATEAAYTLSGKVEPGADLTINGTSVTVESDGLFAYQTTLVEGENTFAISAIDTTGTHSLQQNVTLDTQVPTVYEFTPEDNYKYGGVHMENLHAHARDQGTGVTRIAFEVSIDDGQNWVEIGAVEGDELDDSWDWDSGERRYYWYCYYNWDPSSEVEQIGQLADGAYKFRAVAYDKAGNASNGTPVRVWQIDNTAPAAPSNLTATSDGPNAVNLTWTANTETDLTNYRIYRSTTQGSDYRSIGYSDTSSYRDTEVSAGVDYYYVVTARDEFINESGYSNEANVTTQVDDVSPSITYLSLSDEIILGGPEINLSIRATDDSIDGVDDFRLDYSTDGGASWELGGTYYARKAYYGNYYYRDIKWYTSGLNSGEYLLRLTAIDYSGNESSLLRHVTMDLEANAPQNLSASPGNGTIILTWDQVADDDFHHYEILRANTALGTYQEVAKLNEQTNTYSDSKVQGGQNYFYKVLFKDDYGNSAISNMTYAVPGEDTTAPEITYLTPADGATTGGPNVYINVRATDNQFVTKIQVLYSKDDGTSWEEIFTENHVSNGGSYFYTNRNWFTDEEITSGNYIIRIKAWDDTGNEGYRDFNWNIDMSVNPVSNLSATPDESGITLSWDLPTDTDLPYYPYSIWRSETPGGPYTKRTSYINATTTSYRDSYNLSPEKTYYYIVKTKDEFGNITESEEICTALLGETVPPYISKIEPANGSTIGGATDQRLQINFEENSGMSGTEAQFKYSYDGSAWTPISGTIHGPNRTNSSNTYSYYLDWDLEPLASGPYMVRYTVIDGSDNVGEQTVTYQVDRTAPDAPGNLRGSYGSGIISLHWEILADAGVKKYNIYRSAAEEGPFNLLGSVDGSTNVTFTDSTVQTGLTYWYRVTALDEFDQEGVESNTVAVAAQEDDVPPEILGIEPANYTIIGPQAEITVRAEDNLALANITLQYSDNDGVDWVDIDTKSTVEGAATFEWNTAPLNGKVLVRAIARDAKGNISDGTPERKYTVDNQGPSQITGLTGTVTATSVLLRWDDVSDDDFAYFLVERKNSDGSFQEVGKITNQLGMNVTNLEPNTTYWYRVVAYDKFENRGTPSEEIEVYTVDDNNAPVVLEIRPSPGAFNSEISLSASTWEDNGLASFTFMYSADSENWSEITTLTGYNEQSPNIGYTWDVSELAEGTYYVKGSATDFAGNTSDPDKTPIIQYRIDRTPLGQPPGFKVTPTTSYITLTWEQNPEQDLQSYNIYRATGNSGQYTFYKNVRSLGYHDTDVDQGVTYSYKVSALDFAGNEGDVAGPLSAKLSQDTEAPDILSIYPASEEILAANPRIYISAVDNYQLSKATLEYHDGNDWTVIGTKNLTTSDQVAIIEWNTANLNDGYYSLRATVTDVAGNVSESMEVSYGLNVDPPKAPVISASPGGWKVDLSWVGGGDPDLAGFRLYRSTAPGGPYELLYETTKTSFSDSPLSPGLRYYYVVDAVDRFGNSSRSKEVDAVPTIEDTTDPVADAGDDQISATGLEVYCDGMLSYDNNRIEKYQWDFGDGFTSSVGQPAHTYTEPGEYTVTLTVFDPAGNSATDSFTVKVLPRQEVGNLEVKVLDDVSGAAIPRASVVVQFPDGTVQKSITDNEGKAYVVASPGEYKIYAYKNEYKPAAIDATLEADQQNKTTVRLKRGQLVIGELNVRRMTLDEIIDAGVDINAPENQWMYKFEIHLTFNNTPLPPASFMANSAGQSFGSGGGGGGGGSGISFTDDAGQEFVAHPVIIPSPRPEVRPSIAYLVLPGEARWLKEFFEVGLVLENTADPEFIISQSTARLNLPDGLALAPTREKQSLQVELGDVAGGESREVKWIIRGDKKGEYNLEAEFNGILQPFGDPVATLFRTKEPFRVWGDDALRMHIDAQDQANKGYPYHVRFGMENVSEVPVYMLSLKLLDAGKQNYIYAPNQELTKSVRELPPGETLWKDYWLIPSIEGNLDLNNSYALQTGGNTSVQTDFTKHSVPEFEPDNCPVLKQTNYSDGTVDLSWDPVEGAIGYRIYRIRDDLLISMEPELVYETSNPEITSINLEEQNGPNDYVMNTVFSDGERIRHAITGMSWKEKVGAPVITVDPTEVNVGQETMLWITVNKQGAPVVGGTVDIGSYASDVELDQNGQAKVSITPTKAGEIIISAYDPQHQFLVSTTVNALAHSDPPPAVPTGLTAVPGADNRQVELSWDENTEPDLAGYNIYQLLENNESQKPVRIRVTLDNPDQKDSIQLKYLKDGNYKPLIFNESGIAWYGPAGGFPLSNASIDFKVTFSAPGTFGYTMEIVAVEDDAVLASTNGSVEVTAVQAE